MVKQFTALRDGDRFFYLNETWTPDELRILKQGDTLAKVIEANTGVQLQPDVFIFQASISGTVYKLDGFQMGGAAWVTVELEQFSDDHLSINILATTVTDAKGNYSFNQLSGPAANSLNSPGVSSTGDYNVAIVLPSGNIQISPDPSTTLIGGGGMKVKEVDFLITNNPGWEPAVVTSGVQGSTKHNTELPQATSNGSHAPSPPVAQAPGANASKALTVMDSGSVSPGSGDVLDVSLDDWLAGQSLERSLLIYSKRKTQDAG